MLPLRWVTGPHQVEEVVDLSVSANPFIQQLFTGPGIFCARHILSPQRNCHPAYEDSLRTVVVFLWVLHARPGLDYAVGSRALVREREATQKSRTSLLAEYGFQEGRPQIITGIAVNAGEARLRCQPLFCYSGCVTSCKPFPSLVFSSPSRTRKGENQL